MRQAQDECGEVVVRLRYRGVLIVARASETDVVVGRHHRRFNASFTIDQGTPRSSQHFLAEGFETAGEAIAHARSSARRWVDMSLSPLPAPSYRQVPSGVSRAHGRHLR